MSLWPAVVCQDLVIRTYTRTHTHLHHTLGGRMGPVISCDPVRGLSQEEAEWLQAHCTQASEARIQTKVSNCFQMCTRTQRVIHVYIHTWLHLWLQSPYLAVTMVNIFQYIKNWHPIFVLTVTPFFSVVGTSMAVPALCLPQPHTHPKECMGNTCTPHHHIREKMVIQVQYPPLRRQDPTSRGRKTQHSSELKG